MKTQMLRFGLSGVAGYIVDSFVLYAVMALGMGFLRGRLVSFVCAVIATFVLNRRYTFAEQLNGTLRPPLWLEFGRYLAAMALGGVLNLATYWLVLRVTPHFPALFALAVAAGSLVGMVVNFASAKWWVFIHRPEHKRLLPTLAFTTADTGWRLRIQWPERRIALPFKLTTARCLLLAQAVFWLGHFTEMELPGLYMDAANPDYLAARALNPGLPNPVGVMPTVHELVVLGNLYHGVQNFYVALPVFALLGFNMLALRVAQGLFAGGIVVMTQLVLQRASGSLALAFAGALGVATELAFLASFRTQMYIVMSGAFWLLLAIYLALGRNTASGTTVAAAPIATSSRSFAQLPALPWFLSGLCAGLAVYSYFVFLFFVPVFVLLGWRHTRNWRAALIWTLGFALGMQTYVLGYALAIYKLGGFALALEWLRSTARDLAPMSSELTLGQNLANTWSVLVLTLQNVGNELVIFRATAPETWAIWKVRLLLAMPLLLAALGIFHSLAQRGRTEAEPRVQGLLATWHVALLPVAFVLTTLIFGNRLWSHHFSPMIPLAYLVLFLAVYQAQIVLRRSLPMWIGVTLMTVLLVGNVQQQQKFFARLETTGGVTYFSNAINRMADDALGMPADVVHVFPEWGFMTPFALLTANQRIYDLDISDANLQRLAGAGSTLRVYYWLPETGSSYRDKLVANGYTVSAGGAYLQRDQQPAFYWLEAVVAGSAR